MKEPDFLSEKCEMEKISEFEEIYKCKKCKQIVYENKNKEGNEYGLQKENSRNREG